MLIIVSICKSPGQRHTNQSPIATIHSELQNRLLQILQSPDHSLAAEALEILISFRSIMVILRCLNFSGNSEPNWDEIFSSTTPYVSLYRMHTIGTELVKQSDWGKRFLESRGPVALLRFIFLTCRQLFDDERYVSLMFSGYIFSAPAVAQSLPSLARGSERSRASEIHEKFKELSLSISLLALFGKDNQIVAD
jgi:hypothetical protein